MQVEPTTTQRVKRPAEQTVEEAQHGMLAAMPRTPQRQMAPAPPSPVRGGDGAHASAPVPGAPPMTLSPGGGQSVPTRSGQACVSGGDLAVDEVDIASSAGSASGYSVSSGQVGNFQQPNLAQQNQVFQYPPMGMGSGNRMPQMGGTMIPMQGGMPNMQGVQMIPIAMPSMQNMQQILQGGFMGNAGYGPVNGNQECRRQSPQDSSSMVPIRMFHPNRSPM